MTNELNMLLNQRVIANDGVNCVKGQRGVIIAVREGGLTVRWDDNTVTNTCWLSIELEGR